MYAHLYCKTSTKLQPNNQTFLAKPNQTKNIRPTRVEPNQSPPCLYYASKFQRDSIELGIAQNMKELLLLVWKGRQATATFAAFFGTGTTNGKSITCSSKLQPAAAAGGGWESGRKEWWKEWRKIPPCAIRDNLSSLMPTPGYPGGILRHRYKRKMYWETILI